MIIKQRCEPVDLRTFRYLKRRLTLSAAEIKNYLILDKGFEGEKEFDKWIKNLPFECLILNDLLLEYDQNVFQLDTLVIFHETIYLINVKNYDGDFYIESDKWFTLSKTEIKDPLLQLKRSEYLLQQMIRSFGFHNYSIEALLLFINPHFQLYQAPMNLPIIFPTQLERFKNTLNKHTAKLNQKDFNLAKQLHALHKIESSYKKTPEYEYNQLKKGILCSSCHSFDLDLSRERMVCRNCGYVEAIHLAILRSIEEFIILFPNKKITTSVIHDWCVVIKSKKTIRRILRTYFKHIGYGSSSYYISD